MRISRKRVLYIVCFLFITFVVIAVGLACWAILIPKHNQLSKCLLNLENINICKQRWANDQTNNNNNTIPSWDDLLPYLPESMSNNIPTCPDGGVYNINRIGKPPMCSIGGPRHILPK